MVLKVLFDGAIENDLEKDEESTSTLLVTSKQLLSYRIFFFLCLTRQRWKQLG